MITDLEQRILERGGCPIHYWISDKQEGPWLIFLHGTAADHRAFEEQLPVVFQDFRVILVDLRGHGLSRTMGRYFSVSLVVDDLLAIMDNENCIKASFIGQSIGGQIGQQMIWTNPDRVESLVCIDSPCNTLKLTAWDRLIKNLPPLLLRLLPWRALVYINTRISTLSPKVRNYLKETYKLIGKKDFMKVFTEGASCVRFKPGYKIEHNMLLVCGDKDRVGTIKKLTPVWASREPHCEFHIISRAGHCSNQDNPEAFNALLWDFLKGRYGL